MTMFQFEEKKKGGYRLSSGEMEVFVVSVSPLLGRPALARLNLPKLPFLPALWFLAVRGRESSPM